MFIKPVSAIRFGSAFSGGCIYAVLSILTFSDFTLWRTAIVIISWGAGAYAGLHFRQGKSDLDPSWSFSYLTGIICYSVMFLLFFPFRWLLTGFDYLSFVITFTYIGAKAGCYINGCCRAIKFTDHFNPGIYNSLNWLAYTEIVFTVLAMVLALFISSLAQTDGVFFMLFSIFHLFIRIYSYTFRHSAFNKTGVIIPASICAGFILIFYII